MMISPETYYEMNLKGKSAEQIMTAIRGLKQEIGRLKNTMEHPEYGTEVIICPSEATQLSCTRDYLDRAKLALAEAGVVYKPSQAELKAAAFEENIPAISKVVFTIGGFLSGHETYTITLDDEHLHRNVEHTFIPKPSNFFVEPDCPVGKEEFLAGIKHLHIGEWRRSYQPERFGYSYCDGTQWELEIQFSNGAKPFKSYGSNSYPYNFNEFQELLGIDTTEEDYEEKDDE